MWHLEQKMFMKYIRDGKSASDAIRESRSVVSHLLDMDLWWEEFV